MHINATKCPSCQHSRKQAQINSKPKEKINTQRVAFSLPTQSLLATSFATLASPVFGHWCDKVVMGCITPGGNPLAKLCVSVCMSVHVPTKKGRMPPLKRLAIAPASLSPAPTPPPHPRLHSDVQLEQIW